MEAAAIQLRPWRTADLDAVAELRNDLSLQRLLMARAQPESHDEVLEWLGRKSRQTDVEFLLIAKTEDDRVVGYIQATALDHRSGTADLGICLMPEAQGQGFGRQACLMFHMHLARKFGLRKLVLRVLADNARAIALYRQLGYRDVGTLLSHHRGTAMYHDVLIMEIFLTP